jgi:hypothetical protein
MSLDDVFKVFGDIAMAADGLSYAIVGALTLVAFVLMRAMLPVKGLAYVFAPAMFWGGLVGIYTASTSGIVVSTEKAVNSAATATLGMIGALVVAVLLTRLVEAALRIRSPLAYDASADRRPQA